jgi:NAD(P)-dependent dehydrogenase (short-subunit alcohol dehydrogenase family)
MRAVSGQGLIVAAAAVTAALAARAALRGRGPAIRGQVVLITGGSRGLGLALARRFAREGCRIAICARDEKELERARGDLASRGADVLTVPCDVTSQEQIAALIERVLGHFGRIDILVNNAGEIQVGPVESMTLDDFRHAMNVMFWGTVYPTMALLPHFSERRSGRIVNITSIGGKVSVPHLLPYNCAKFAAVGFSEGLRAELADKGVKVVTIAPGLMRTGSYLNAFFKGDQERESTWFSLSSTMPLLTISGDRAARQIVDATRRGDAVKILTTPANALARFHGMFPGATTEILGLVNRLILPSGTGRRSKRGSDTGALRGPVLSAATVLGRVAARRFLQPRPAVARS